jgi:hypothetical protein
MVSSQILIILGLNILSRFANQSARFISAYDKGLSGAQAAWANKKYHGHHTLPPKWVLTARNLNV